MTTPNERDLLIEILETALTHWTPQRFAQGSFAKTQNNKITKYQSDDAVKFCGMGILLHAACVLHHESPVGIVLQLDDGFSEPGWLAHLAYQNDSFGYKYAREVIEQRLESLRIDKLEQSA